MRGLAQNVAESVEDESTCIFKLKGHSFRMQKRKWMTKLVDPGFDWRLLQAFLDVVECGTFRAASLQRRFALNTVRARVGELERLVGRKLLDRSVEGVTVTKAGDDVLRVINAMVKARAETISSLIDES